jgi:hypothetical protein
MGHLTELINGVELMELHSFISTSYVWMDACFEYVYHAKKALDVATSMHNPTAYFEREAWGIIEFRKE